MEKDSGLQNGIDDGGGVGLENFEQPLVGDPVLPAVKRRKELVDYSDPYTIKTALTKLRQDFRAGVFGNGPEAEDKFKEKRASLVKYSYLDMMNQVILEAEGYIRAYPDESAENIINHLVRFGRRVSHGLSNVQQGNIRIGVERYCEDRRIIRATVAKINSGDTEQDRAGRREFLDSLGMGYLNPDRVEFDFSHPSTIGLILEEDDFFTVYDVPDEDRQINGFYANRHTLHYPGAPELNGKLIFINKKNKSGPLIDHELSHRNFYEYLNPQLYDTCGDVDATIRRFIDEIPDTADPEKIKKRVLEAVSEFEKSGFIIYPESWDITEKTKFVEDLNTFSSAKRLLQDELLAYLESGSFRTSESALLGKEISRRYFYNILFKIKLRRMFDAIIFEINRLETKGYAPKQIAGIVRTSENLSIMIDRMQSIEEGGEDVKMACKTMRERMLTDVESDFLRSIWYEDEVDIFTGVRITPEFQLDLMAFIKSNSREIAEAERLRSILVNSYKVRDKIIGVGIMEHDDASIFDPRKKLYILERMHLMLTDDRQYEEAKEYLRHMYEDIAEIILRIDTGDAVNDEITRRIMVSKFQRLFKTMENLHSMLENNPNGIKKFWEYFNNLREAILNNPEAIYGVDSANNWVDDWIGKLGDRPWGKGIVN